MTPAEHNETQQPTLKAFLDNELSWGKQFAVRLHLARCASCREELRAMQQIGKELRGQTTIDPLDPGLRARILATVQEMKPEPTAPVRSRRPVLIWGGAAFAAVLLAAVFVSSQMFAPASKSMFGPGSRGLFAPPTGKTDAPEAEVASGAPGSPSSASAPQEMDKFAGESPRLESPRLATPPMALESRPGGSVAAHTAQKTPEAANRVAQSDSAFPSLPEAQASLQTPLPRGKDAAGNGSVEAKKMSPAPVAGLRARAPRNLAQNTQSSAYNTGGGFQSKAERTGDGLAIDRVNLSPQHGGQQRVVLERAGFDLDGFQFVTQKGQKIAVPFHKSLNAVRFARATDGRMALDKTSQSPILYLTPADWLVNDAVPGSRWQPLPPSITATQPLYVRPAPDWEQFTAMRWYPNMTVVGGLYSVHSAEDAFTWLSGSHVQIGATLYPDFAAYRAFADSHPDSQRLRAVYTPPPTPSPAVPVKSPPSPGVPPANNSKAAGRAGKPTP